MNATDVGVRFRWLLTALLGPIAVGGGTVDLVLDNSTTFWRLHVLVETAMLLLSLGTVAYLWIGWRDASRKVVRTQSALEAHASERAAWRARAEKILRGLGEEIDRPLQEWELTPVERQTALMLLKGLDHKEIAELQQKSERTVRQHAVSVYRKSGLSGLAELSAFFLEDLLLPVIEPKGARAPA